MKLMNCPLNGPRNISEFLCFGAVRPALDPASCSDRDWADHVFMEANRAGVVHEWWYHLASGYWFVAERDTRTDEILATYPPDRLAAAGASGPG